MDYSCGCGNYCLEPASEVLNKYKGFYDPCNNCKEIKLKKFSPLSTQMDLNNLTGDFGRCKCGKRHLDLVMSHILKILIEEGVKDQKSTLRNVCVPLITPSYPLNSVPFLQKDSLVILSRDVNEKCAQRIVSEIPEVKGVLKGDLKDTVGIKESKSGVNTYNLLAGCDMRCDIVNTPWKVMCIYKKQGIIHIELPQPLSPKIKELKKVLDKYDSPTVLDSTCGPGTLGIAALFAGASKVVFNDLWYPACQTTIMNLEINGFPLKSAYCENDLNSRNENSEKGLIAHGDNFDVYNLDINDLESVLTERFDICLVDVFPGVDSKKFTDAVGKICKKIVII